jgi:hypothetical protein
MRLVKLILRALFTAHAIGLAMLAYVGHYALSLTGTMRTASVRTNEDALVLIAFVAVFWLLGWLAGNEFRALEVRRVKNERDKAIAHGAYLRGLNAEMIDDVFAAARAGVPVKSLLHTFAAQTERAE